VLLFTAQAAGVDFSLASQAATYDDRARVAETLRQLLSRRKGPDEKQVSGASGAEWRRCYSLGKFQRRRGRFAQAVQTCSYNGMTFRARFNPTFESTGFTRPEVICLSCSIPAIKPAT